MPAPGRPCAVSSTWVVSLPIRVVLVVCEERLRIDRLSPDYVRGGSRLHVRGYIPVGVIEDARRVQHCKKLRALMCARDRKDNRQHMTRQPC